MKPILVIGLLLTILHVSFAQKDVELTADNFEATLQKNPQTFVKFYSPYCGWCQKLAPIWTDLTVAFEGALAVVAVDVTKYPSLASSQGVNGVPTMKFYNGKDLAAIYDGPRVRAAFLPWLLERVNLLKMAYGTPAWKTFSTAGASHPLRFAYIHDEAETPQDIGSLFKKLRTKGVVAQVSVPSDKIAEFKELYGISEIPSIVTARYGKLHSFKREGLDDSVEEYTLRINEENQKELKNVKSMEYEDSHSTFSFLFFIVAMGAIGTVAWKKLRIGHRVDAHKQV